MSLRSRSKRSAQRCPPVSASISCALILIRLPARRMLPSSTVRTPRPAGHHADVDRLALVGEARIARDHHEAADLGEVGDHVFGDPVSKVFLLGIAAHVLKRQHRDRRPVRRRELHRSFFRRRELGRRRGFRFDGNADPERIDPNRLRDVLEADLAFVADRQIEPRPDLSKSVLGEADRARLGDAFQSRGNIDAVAHQIAVGFLDDVAEMDANTKLNAALGRHAGVAFDHRVLHLQRAAHGVDDGTELDQRAVAGPLDHPPVVHRDRRVDEIAAQGAESRQSAVLVRAGQTANPTTSAARMAASFRPSAIARPRCGAFLLAAPDADSIHGCCVAIHDWRELDWARRSTITTEKPAPPRRPAQP